MASFTIPSVIILSFLTVASTTLAQTQQDWLEPHNAARAQVGVQPLVWHPTLENYARYYAQTRAGDCAMIHSQDIPYGENLAAGSGSFSARDAVRMWVNEISNYDYGSNSCVGGECLHYTQVVWADTNYVGCARARCDNGWYFTICNYYPPGNYIGQRPFGKFAI